MNQTLGRLVIALLTNHSGGTLTQGAVVIVDSTFGFVTTTTARYKDGQIGVIIEPNGIANNEKGLVAFVGIVPKLNLPSSATALQTIATHTVAGQGAAHNTPILAGDFALALESGTSPQAYLFGLPVQADGDAVSLQGFAIDTMTPDDGDVLTWNAYDAEWEPAAPGSAGASPLLDSTGTRVDIKNDNTEQTVYTFSVPGGTLGTKNALKLILQARIIHSIAGTLTIRFKYGGTTMLTITVPEGVGTADKSSDIWFLLAATGATNTQRVSGRVDMQDSNNGIRSRWNQEGTAAVDSTASQTLAVTVQWGSASNSLEYDQSWAGLLNYSSE
jgi:hypothetical protein